jgi:hypothetical protein
MRTTFSALMRLWVEVGSVPSVAADPYMGLRNDAVQESTRPYGSLINVCAVTLSSNLPLIEIEGKLVRRTTVHSIFDIEYGAAS